MSLYSRLRAVSLEVRYQISCREALWPLMKPYSMTRTRRFMRSEEARPEEARVHRGLSIVVDGFPGSANSFAMRAFRAMQGESPACLIGNHYHSPAETIRATALDIPVLLTLRRPLDSVGSMVRRWPFVPFNAALRWYAMFYEAVEPHLGKMIVSDFETTTGRFASVVGAVNDQFGTDFRTILPEDRMEEFEPRLRQDEHEQVRRREQAASMRERFMEATSQNRRETADRVYERVCMRAFDS